jgi:hypothetical protein
VNTFQVTGTNGTMPVSNAKLRDKKILAHADDPDRTEMLVQVKWLKTVPEDKAIWEPGFVANQNSACKLRSHFTIDRLVERFGLKEGA